MQFATSVQRWLVIAIVPLLAAGCKELRLRSFTAPAAPPDNKTDETKKTPTAGSSSEPVPDTPLDRDGWNALEPLPPLEGYRWRYPELEAMLDLPPEERPELAAALTGGNVNAANNAAILLARAGHGSGRQRLLKTVRSSTARLPLRCACAEALAAIAEPPAVGDLRELVDRYGQFPSEAYVPDLHAELLYGLAAHVDAGGDPRFAAAAKSPAAQVRLAAVRGWLRPGDSPLADAAADLRTDSDPRVRAAALAALAARRQPLALEAARNALTDLRLEVRMAAIAALGEIGGDEAEQSLVRLDREPEIIRAAAIVALGKLGARERVWSGAESDSWHIRKAAVQALRAWPDVRGVLLARRLLDDRSIEVQKELYVTLAAWPLETSGPVLLEAMGGDGYLSRKTAALQLAERWPA
ncbi:MAG: HEAT repeat domain-containing protein, partial [Pirellulales bacterium]